MALAFCLFPNGQSIKTSGAVADFSFLGPGVNRFLDLRDFMVVLGNPEHKIPRNVGKQKVGGGAAAGRRKKKKHEMGPLRDCQPQHGARI